MPALESVRYSRGSLEVLDQLLVPHQKAYVPVADADGAWQTIRTMQVRGAPLIAMVAALGLAVEAERRREKGAESAAEAAVWLEERMAHLRTSRPTAVNLFHAMDALGVVTKEAAEKPGAGSGDVLGAYVVAAEAMLAEDVAANKAIGDVGADAILAAMAANGRAGEKARIATICNTGSLATAGWGTALGIIRTLHARGKLEQAYALETRPYNQGARLTSFEFQEDGIPGTLICDSMAAALMSRKGVDAVVVGADRVAANGDTANKIGTYGLSIIAKHHGVPFYVASPTTTLDVKTASGKDIPIEERAADELRFIEIGGKRQCITCEGMPVWNPAFDVTPASLITGVATERGLIPRKSEGGDFDVASF